MPSVWMGSGCSLYRPDVDKRQIYYRVCHFCQSGSIYIYGIYQYNRGGEPKQRNDRTAEYGEDKQPDPQAGGGLRAVTGGV